MTRKQQRMVLVGVVFALLAGSAALITTAMRDTIVFFVTPSDVAARDFDPSKRFRLGGLVREGSVERKTGGEVRFVVTDEVNDVSVIYAGLLPDLFREGQGIVAQGRLDPDGTFHAVEVLAKHDENYMPAEVKEALEEANLYRHNEESPDP
ncbi:MAG: cytochrome c maturation protein CcmE [Geminicoccaceae bacterium]